MVSINTRIDIIDYLKGFSIFTIVLYHLIQFYEFYVWDDIIKTASNLGGAGVHVFFVCSGFGLYLSYIKKPISFKDFILKRMSKIYIPYILIVLISALIPYMYVGKDRFIALLSHIFLFKMFVPRYESSFGGQLWFISTIIQFYLVFYLLIWLKRKIGNKTYVIMSFLISLIYGIIVCMAGKEDIRTWNSFFLQYLWEFSLGMICAELYVKGIKIKINALILLLISIVCLIITGITGSINGYYKMFNDYTSLVGYGGLLLFIYYLQFGKLNRFFMWMSKFSYMLFLVHILTFEILYRLFAKYCPSIIIFLLVLTLDVCVGYLCNYIYIRMTSIKILESKKVGSGILHQITTDQRSGENF